MDLESAQKDKFTMGKQTPRPPCRLDAAFALLSLAGVAQLFRRFLFVVSIAFVPEVSAFYTVGSLLPGDGVDVQTDLTQYSFSVPHQLKKFGGILAPGYSYSSHDIEGNAMNSHEGRMLLAAFAQLADFRIGAVSKQNAYGLGTGNRYLQSDNKLMVSYLMRFLSFGIEAGGFRSTTDNPVDRWGTQFALSSSIYFNKWAIDAIARIYRPNSSFAAPYPIAESHAELYSFQNANADSDLYSLRWRYDLSFHWRTTLAGNYLRSGYGQIGTISNLWRYRANAMQVITGLRFEQSSRSAQNLVSAIEQRELHWPVLLILEHSRSIFYVGGSSPVYKSVSFSGFEQKFWTLRFEPRVAYIYRFSGKFWAGFSVAEQSAIVTQSDASAIVRKEIRAAFQITYNLVPFGYDDEIPLSDGLLVAGR